ncbi:MAG: epoxide hydrolase [Desulfobacterales bacterium]|nr:MAG: epoxide hydrolase [Desulfobacterales bacterium]
MEPYKIAIPDAVLEDLRRRLAQTRWPGQIQSGWDAGTDRSYLKKLCDYWQTGFDWRAQEKALNRFAHFRTEIANLKIHYIHQRSTAPNALPLVITHGWPGSIFEFTKIVGPLADPVAHGGRAEDAFHVVCPSLPGFGFSEPPRAPGFDVKKAAEVVVQLMARLGYARYGAQGGDWGSSVASWLGALDAGHVCGIHLNLVAGRPPEGVADPEAGLTAQEKQYLAHRQEFLKYETGYREIQSTKPQTLGYGLNDSPVGLAGWIVEKFYTWTDCQGDLERRLTPDELLTNLTIYWATQTITSSMRLYYETRKTKNLIPERVEVPVGCAIFPREIYNSPRPWAENVYNIQRWTEMPAGGHFAALEEPELLVEDLRAFYRPLR